VAREVGGRQEASPEGHTRGRCYRSVAGVIFIVKATGAAKTGVRPWGRTG
jgi:hypothetical protein